MRRRDVRRAELVAGVVLAAHRELRAHRVVRAARAVEVGREALERRVLRDARGERHRADAGHRALPQRHRALAVAVHLPGDALLHGAVAVQLDAAPARHEGAVLDVPAVRGRRRDLVHVVAVGGVVQLDVVEALVPVVEREGGRVPQAHVRVEGLLQVGDARGGRAVRRVLVVVVRVAAEAVQRVRPHVEVLVGRVADAEALQLVVEVDHQVRRRAVERRRDVQRVLAFRDRRVRQVRQTGREVRVPRVRAHAVREVQLVRLEVLLALEVEAQRLAHRVRRDVVVVAPRVVAHELHADRLLGAEQQPVRADVRRVRRNRRHQLHPLVVAHALADAHEVVRAVRRQTVVRRVGGPVGDGDDAFRPVVTIVDGSQRIVLERVIGGILLRDKEIFDVADATIECNPGRACQIRGIISRGGDILLVKGNRTPFRHGLIEITPPPNHARILQQKSRCRCRVRDHAKARPRAEDASA